MNLSSTVQPSYPTEQQMYALARTPFTDADTAIATVHNNVLPTGLNIALAADEIRIGVNALTGFVNEKSLPQPVRDAAAQALVSAKPLVGRLQDLVVHAFDPKTDYDATTKFVIVSAVDLGLHNVLDALRDR